MNQPALLYDIASALPLLEPWLRSHLPDLDEGALRHFIQLVTGIVEQHSLLLREIAAGSVLQASPESNYTQVQRIIRDQRLSLETVYYPFLTQILAHVPGDELYVTLDQTNHGSDFNLVLVGWATDAISLPLGFLLYPTDGVWADDARILLQRLDQLIPQHFSIIALADRIHTGEPFIATFEALDWQFVLRAPEDTLLQHERDGWVELRHLRQRAGRLRVFRNVRIWKTHGRCVHLCLLRRRGPDGKMTVWYLVTNIEPSATRFLEYACRWWQECTHKLLKSGYFDWERGRVTEPSRVLILLMGFGCACWALWLLGRTHEHRTRRKVTTTRSQSHRHNVIKWGWEVLRSALKRRQTLILPQPCAPRVLTYQRRFPGFRLPCAADTVELW